MENSPAITCPTVFIVDDDAAMRECLSWLFKANGLHVECFASGAELLEAYDPAKPGCLLLDVRLPEMSGNELYRALLDRGCRHPAIFITGNGDVPTAVSAMKDGAVDFIEKPFPHEVLLARIREAIELDSTNREKLAQAEKVRERISSLTPREMEVMGLVAAGKLTKQIAKRLNISTKTVEVHRSNITKKMQVASVAQLVRLLTKYEGELGSEAASPDFPQGFQSAPL